jgi:hyperosmotically inducible periplasmic protein
MRIIIGFIIGIVVGAYSLRVYERRNAVPPIASNPAVSDTTREAATGMGQAVSEKLADWHLTPDEVKADLSRSGQVVREKAQVAGDRIVDARIVTVIKAKYVLDHNLSARDINVDARDGVVTLGGTVASADLIGRAVMLALETDGVSRVVSQITIQP